jgi:MFS family permease
MTGSVRAEDLPLARRAMAFAFLALAYVFYSYAWNTVDVLRPYIRTSAGLTLGQAGLMYTAQSLGALAGALVIGQLADRFGRRRLLLVVMLGHGTALLAGVWCTTLPSLLVQRAVLGIFLGGVFSVSVGLYISWFDSTVRGRLAAVIGVMYSVGVIFQGWLATWLLDRDWTLMLWAGALPTLVLALGCLLLVPDDRHTVPYGGAAPTAPVSRLPIVELFRPEYRRLTLMLTLLSGLSFFGYQAFGGWVTTYLKEVRGLGGAGIGGMVAWQGMGGLLGGFIWGWVADRFGRRINAIGFVVAAALIVLYLRAPNDPVLLQGLGFVYGFMISAGVAWGVYFAELYPAHLRSTAASIFHWGRAISFFAPAVTAAVAESAGLTTGMALAALLYLVAAGVWWLLPETLVRRLPTARMR